MYRDGSPSFVLLYPHPSKAQQRVKVKVTLQQAMKALYPRGKRPSTHCIVGWVGPMAGLDGCGKSPPTEFDARTVQ